MRDLKQIAHVSIKSPHFLQLRFYGNQVWPCTSCPNHIISPGRSFFFISWLPRQLTRSTFPSLPTTATQGTDLESITNLLPGLRGSCIDFLLLLWTQEPSLDNRCQYQGAQLSIAQLFPSLQFLINSLARSARADTFPTFHFGISSD